MKNKHRIKQGLALLLAGGIALTNLGAALPAFAEDALATPETAEAATPETAEANVPTPNLSQITENLYDDLPDAPTGSYLGSMGLPVATGETKISISAWVSDLYDGVDAHMDADALNADENTVTIGKTPGTDYAIVPLTPEEQEELRKKEERKDRLHQNYLRRKANGKQKEWEERYNAKRKAKMEAAKAAIRAEDMEKGIFTTVSQLPRQEPRKATLPASAAV